MSSGTSNTENLGFKAKEICDILKTAAQSGVKSLEIGGLKVKFGEMEPEVTDVPSPVLSLEGQNDVVDELHEAQTLIDDPEAFEDSQIAAQYQRMAESNV